MGLHHDNKLRFENYKDSEKLLELGKENLDEDFWPKYIEYSPNYNRKLSNDVVNRNNWGRSRLKRIK